MERTTNGSPKVLIINQPSRWGYVSEFDLRDEARHLEYTLTHRLPLVDAAYFGHSIPLTESQARYYARMYMHMQNKYNPTHFVMLSAKQRLYQQDPIFTSPFAEISGMFEKPTLIACISESPQQQIISPDDPDKNAEYAYIGWKGWGNLRDCVLEFISRKNESKIQSQLVRGIESRMLRG